MAKVMTPKVTLANVKFGVRAILLLGVIGTVNAEAERCVPTAEGGWRCGKEVTEADAAPLPERQLRSLPPVMLIDPARFGEGDIDTPTPPEASAEPPVAAVIAEVVEVVSPASSTPATAQIPADANLPAGNNFAVQLAVASSPRGFDALLAKLGTAARTSQRRQLANGSWVLLIGSFNSIAQARTAVPDSVPGAFARDISTLNFR